LSCVKLFAVRFISGARQRDWLPCVFYTAHGKEKTHGKQAFCRAPEKTHGKDLICRAFYFLAHGKDFSPTAVSSRQQTSRCEVSLPCVFGKTHGK
jgi:hypothetical protein